MGAARALDLLLGAAATAGSHPGARTGPARGGRAVLHSAALLGVHTAAVTTVSRREAQGGSTAAPLAALTVTALLGAAIGRRYQAPRPAGRTAAGTHRPAGYTRPAGRVLTAALAAGYVATCARPLLHAALNPSPPLTQRAVGGGIRSMIPLQAALSSRSGATGSALGVLGLVPVARALARKVSPT